MMNYHVLTLFPEMILQGLHTSIIGRAIEGGHICLEAVNIRDYADNKHNKVDDYPYGGGAGMVMQAEPVYRACRAVQDRIEGTARVIYVTPQGRVFNQSMAAEFAEETDLIFLCGHYEGIDERVLEEVVTDYVSIGDYVLTGGELPAMVMIDAISRLVPGVLNNEASAEFESFHDNLLEYPQYSRPEEWKGKRVPPVLLSGNHTQIEGWRRELSLMRTRERRPDLYETYLREEKAGREVEGKKSRRKVKAVLFDRTSLCRNTPEDGEFLPYGKEMLLFLKEQELLSEILGEESSLEETVRRFWKQESIKRTEILVFAGTASAVEKSREAGLRTVYIPKPGQEKEEPSCGYYRKISDLAEGMAILRGMV